MSGSQCERFPLAVLRSAPLFAKLSLLDGRGELRPSTPGCSRDAADPLIQSWHWCEGLGLEEGGMKQPPSWEAILGTQE